MKTEIFQPKTLVITAWVFILIVIDLPQIILQEIFDYQVSNNLEYRIATVAVVAGVGLAFTQIDGLPIFDG